MSHKTAMSRGEGRQPQLPQMDLFKNGLPGSFAGAPRWPELPAKARATLTSLMARLILDHAEKTATPPRKGDQL
ncbi:hypothetical protein [Rhodomicrobium sp. R_RK_3]|uniref:hypothetical protein n=1 Tax=Rhodomicrobium sp. R_RK_3 TaxID=2029567 RepID=UPI000F739778|nr:hypothetical protein [Rhodomicrobium sp. R_RK_3]